MRTHSTISFILACLFVPLGCQPDRTDSRAPVREELEHTIDAAGVKKNDPKKPFSDESGKTNNGFPLAQIKIKDGSPSLPVGTRTGWVAVGIYEDKSAREISKLVNWKISDKSKATLQTNPPGTVLTKATGQFTLQARLGNIEGTQQIDVSDAFLLSIKIEAPTTSLPIGGNGMFVQALGRYSDNKWYDVTNATTLVSSRSGIADIVNTESKEGFLRGKSEGSVTITGTYPGQKAATLEVKITAREPWSLHVNGQANSDAMPACITRDEPPEPPSSSKYTNRAYRVEGDRYTGFATLYWSDCSYQIITDDVEWYRGGGDDIGQFTNGPYIDNLSPGTGEIYASFQGKYSNRANVTVHPKELKQLYLPGQEEDLSDVHLGQCITPPERPKGNYPILFVGDTKDMLLYALYNNCELELDNGTLELWWKTENYDQVDFTFMTTPNRLEVLGKGDGTVDVWAELKADATFRSGAVALEIKTN